MKAQRRQFYMGAFKGAKGRNHPLVRLDGVDAVLDKETWRELWGKGPLFPKVGNDDEVMCHKRYVRKAAGDAEKHELYKFVTKQTSQKQMRLNDTIAKAVEANSRLYERRFEVEECWKDRIATDWGNITDDTATRLILWEIYGGMEGCVSPPTTPMQSFRSDIHSDSASRGELPLAHLRNKELWIEASYHAVAAKKATLLEGLPESLVSFSRDISEQWMKDPAKRYLNPHRQALTNHFTNYPTSDVAIPGEKDLENFNFTSLLPLLRWFKGEASVKYSTDREYFLARQEEEIRIREALIKELGKKYDTKAAGVDIANTKAALEVVKRNDKEWRKVLSKQGKTMHAEQAHLLSAIPLEPVPSPDLQSENSEVTLLGKDSFTIQQTLTELLSNTLYKKALIADSGDSVRSAIYELAWLLTKERFHDIYSVQRKELNGLVQKARRKVEVAVNDVVSENLKFFKEENNTPNRADSLYAVDKYSTDKYNFTVVDSHEPFTTGGFKDTSIGVRV
eukprot:TRINITY_DN5334_c0_g1_i1.p1 TRINITY_DN5334_c0_g1~~TRINITY_DN5334_c0_g1_i1.p1  ORF type:complete len:508 (+),score=126.47 TRINITY_DN5334_c0_g1_i1:47-1570(+)